MMTQKGDPHIRLRLLCWIL